MKRELTLVLAVLMVLFIAGVASALTLDQNGNLDEWTGIDINLLGEQPAPDGGSYRVLASLDGTNLYIGVDRSLAGRYLGDSGGDNDSFFIAIDTDGIADSGASQDGYQRMNFDYSAGKMLPDLIVYFAGGPSWYESSTWNGSGWDWNGWTPDGANYGSSESQPDDELVIDLSAALPEGAKTLTVWVWMTREANGYVEASWPAGVTGEQPIFSDSIVIKSLDALIGGPHEPSPSLAEDNIVVENPFVTLEWSIGRDAEGVVDPNLASHKLYIGSVNDPNVQFVNTVSGWDASSLKASYTLTAALERDARYYWRVDQVMGDDAEIEGDAWMFYTELSVPVITSQPDYQLVDADATATFEITVTSLSLETYQWYKNGDALSDGENISGTQSDTLKITDAQVADEGIFHCVIENLSGIPTTSIEVMLGVKRPIAYWDFENANADSVIAGSPISMLYNDPDFTVEGIAGNALEFDNDPCSPDMLIIDPSQAAYFDICNYNMTVAAWIKSSSAVTWGAIVSRNGEDGEGWQIRHNGNTLDRISFTTRGVGDPDDGDPSNRTVYDGQWHYAVGTYDGNVKKVYIDGVLVRVYNSEDGSIAKEGELVTGMINYTSSPVAMASRVKGDFSTDLVIEGDKVTACVLDEVAIYNYALDATAIAKIYADITGKDVCPAKQEYDLNGDCIVNIDDLALIASQWLADISVKSTL